MKYIVTNIPAPTITPSILMQTSVKLPNLSGTKCWMVSEIDATTSSIPKDITNDNQCFLSYKNINIAISVNISAIANNDACPIDFLIFNPTSSKSFVFMLPALRTVNLMVDFKPGLTIEEILIMQLLQQISK